MSLYVQKRNAFKKTKQHAKSPSQIGWNPYPAVEQLSKLAIKKFKKIKIKNKTRIDYIKLERKLKNKIQNGE